MSGPLFDAAKLATSRMSPEETVRFKATAKYVLYADADGQMLLDEPRHDRLLKAESICVEALKVLDKYAVRKNRPTPFPLIGAKGEHYPAVQSIMDKLRDFLGKSPLPIMQNIECHGLDTPERVHFYEQDFYVLSNFSAFTLHWDGQIFDTSEAAYHWEKFQGVPGGWQIQQAILNAPSAHEAYKIAERNKPKRRTDWDDIKVGLMREILRCKVAQHEYVKRKLLDSGDRELVENSWRDDFWGWGPNRDGKNMLGRLWMELRTELRASST